MANQFSPLYNPYDEYRARDRAKDEYCENILEALRKSDIINFHIDSIKEDNDMIIFNYILLTSEGKFTARRIPFKHKSEYLELFVLCQPDLNLALKRMLIQAIKENPDTKVIHEP